MARRRESRFSEERAVWIAGGLQLATAALLVIAAVISTRNSPIEGEPDPARYSAAVVLFAALTVPVGVAVARSRDAVRASRSVIWLLVLIVPVYSVSITNAFNPAYPLAGLAAVASIVLLFQYRRTAGDLCISIDIQLTRDRITAHLRDGTVVFDDVALVALEQSSDGRQLIAGIGKAARYVGQSATVASVVSPMQFDPVLAAAVVRFVAFKSWGDLRRGWKQLLQPLDHLEVSISIEGYETQAPELKDQFVMYLPRRQFTWWVNGEKVKP